MTLLGITGSTGHIGGMVASVLAGQGERLRLVVRDATRAPSLPGAEVAVAEYGDYAASLAALDGVDVLLMVSAAESPHRREQHRTFISAAAAAGVQHLVYTSFVGASPDAVFTLGRDHGDAEAAVLEAGLVHTFLRDNFYADLLPYFADEQGVIRGPAGDGLVAAVARADVADVAAAVLSDPAAHRNATYRLTGPEAISMEALASRASAVLGRDLRFVNETIEEAYASRAKFTDERWLLDAWVSTYTAIADGEVAEVTDDVRALTGHDARRLEQALRGD